MEMEINLGGDATHSEGEYPQPAAETFRHVPIRSALHQGQCQYNAKWLLITRLLMLPTAQALDLCGHELGQVAGALLRFQRFAFA
jgi:hypothetical protein